MRICTFLWIYYGYPSAHYEGVSVEEMRYHCGMAMAERDGFTKEDVDIVAGVPDSGIAHAMGYANRSGVPFAAACKVYAYLAAFFYADNPVEA
ncbi:MAG: hypothetical protein ACLUIQ_07750 [Dialister invisus]